MDEFCKFYDLDFPLWFSALCNSNEQFLNARMLLTEKYGFIPSPTEDGKPNQSLVLPIPGIDLESRFQREGGSEVFGWGIGRAIVDPTYDHELRAWSFEFKYFVGKCSYDLIAPNPMKEAATCLIELLHPFQFFKIGCGEIQNPYPRC